MLVVCSPGEPEELGAQITTDLAEAHGWSVHFAGGGVPNDEIVGWIGQLAAAGADGVRNDPQRDAAWCGSWSICCMMSGFRPKLQIICSGGVFNRAEGLGGGDRFGSCSHRIRWRRWRFSTAYPNKRATPDQQTVGRKRRSKKSPMSKAE